MLRTLSLVVAPVAALFLAPTLTAQSNISGRNVLVIVADDIGVDSLGMYGVGNDVPSTPTLDQLAAGGVVFTQAWANPACSTTRSTILTGRYSFRTGLGFLTDPGFGLTMSKAETTLPELLDFTGTGYEHAAFGKWHLGNESVGGLLSPNIQGFDHFTGTLFNLGGKPADYYIWTKIEDGVETPISNYATSETVDDVLDWVSTAEEPWFCYVGFHAPHDPYHAPPPGLYTTDLSQAGPPKTDPRPYYKAMVEAMDSEMGRLFNGLGAAFAKTTVIFLSDNGSPHDVVVPPFTAENAKGSVHEGGVRVPLIVSSPVVKQPGRVSNRLVNTTDLFATVAELAGSHLADDAFALAGGAHDAAGFVEEPHQLPTFPFANVGQDSISIVPHLIDPNSGTIRRHAFAELFHPNGFGSVNVLKRAVRNERYKLVQTAGSFGSLGEPRPGIIVPGPQFPPVPFAVSLYDLQTDPLEQNDLLEGETLSPQASAALGELENVLTLLLQS